MFQYTTMNLHKINTPLYIYLLQLIHCNWVSLQEVNYLRRIIYLFFILLKIFRNVDLYLAHLNFFVRYLLPANTCCNTGHRFIGHNKVLVILTSKTQDIVEG
jgi:hypothetical protein